jgi:DNA-binding response OmpR family regulator
MKLLVLEDDGDLGPWIQSGLRQQGHVVDLLTDGREALVAATTNSYDVLVMDRMTPSLDGLSVLKSLRAAKVATPALFLTAIAGVDDRVEGLEAGADDYLTKPFAMTELVARVAALGRRAPQADTETTILRAADLELDLVRRIVTRSGMTIELNPKEFLLLEVFLRNQKRVLTRSMLLERVWDLHFDPMTSVVETHVSRLRAKIEKPFGGALIRTVRGAGYMLDPAPAPTDGFSARS